MNYMYQIIIIILIQHYILEFDIDLCSNIDVPINDQIRVTMNRTVNALLQK